MTTDQNDNKQTLNIKFISRQISFSEFTRLSEVVMSTTHLTYILRAALLHTLFQTNAKTLQLHQLEMGDANKFIKNREAYENGFG